ncbi:MAG TPA: phosphoribosyltransferase family protein [Actinomycetota bacterium]|nr:phosphoribosyltransferase family protein [Actinomycetota bacterium]
MFRDRTDAGERLAERLLGRVHEPVTVLGVPRGGVIVAVPVARRLGAALDVVVPRKVRAPGNPELGVGAVAPGVEVLDEDVIARLRIDPAYLAREIAFEHDEVDRRTTAYRGDRPPPTLEGRTAIVVDDGVATGGTATAALRWARNAGAPRLLFAAPVGPASTVARLLRDADEVVVVEAPRTFRAVGEWYETFDQTTDEEVRAALAAMP